MEGKNFGAIAGRHDFKVQQLDKKMVSAGKTDYVILLPEQPTWQEEYAARELQYFFELATGIGLPTLREGGQIPVHFISVGNTRAAEKVCVESSVFGESGCRVLTDGENYLLKGGEYGVIYAVYDLLGCILGLEIFSAKTISLRRNVKDLSLYALDITDIPDFRFRSPSHRYIKKNETLKHRFRMLELEKMLGGEGGPYHNNFNFVPPEKFREKHPYWYSDDGCQMCYTAHGDEKELELLVEEAAAAICRYIRSDPDMPYIAFNHQDNFEWCTCPACTALKEKYGGANSASAAIFLNRVRRKIQEWFDGEGKAFDKGQKLVFFAYHGTNKPPVCYNKTSDTFELIDSEVVLKNVIPWFAETNADYTCPLTEGEVNLPVARNMRGWKLLSDEFLFWTYGTNFSNYLAPYYSFQATQDTYRFAKEQGAGMIFDECQIDTEACTGWEELKAYVSRKLAWNTEEDTKQLTEDFFRASYGCAWERMLKVFREYLDWGREQVLRGFSGFRSEFIDPVYKLYWSREMLERWDAEMSGALQDVQQEKDEKQRSVLTRNIVLERASVRYLLASVFADDMAAADLQKAREAAKKDITDSGITNFCERHPIGELFEKWGV